MRGTVIAVALAAACSCVGNAGAAEAPRGFGQADAEMAASLPLYLVAMQDTVRPQEGLMYVDPMASGFVGGVFGALYASAADRDLARRNAQERWTWLQRGQCSVDADAPVRTALEGALDQAGMKGPVQEALLQGRALAEVVDPSRPRLVVQHSTSFTPDLGVVLTTLTVQGWTTASRGRDDKPAWEDTLMVASTPLNLQEKTEQDTAKLLEIIRQDYAQTGNEQRIRTLNAAGSQAPADERRLAATLQLHYKEQVSEAKRRDWTQDSAPKWRALFWSDNDCAALRQAVQDNAGEAARLLRALYAGQLPVQGTAAPAPAFDAGATSPPHVNYPRQMAREVVAPRAATYLSRPQGLNVLTIFAQRVMEPGQATDAQAAGSR